MRRKPNGKKWYTADTFISFLLSQFQGDALRMYFTHWVKLAATAQNNLDRVERCLSSFLNRTIFLSILLFVSVYLTLNPLHKQHE